MKEELEVIEVNVRDAGDCRHHSHTANGVRKYFTCSGWRDTGEVHIGHACWHQSTTRILNEVQPWLGCSKILDSEVREVKARIDVAKVMSKLEAKDVATADHAGWHGWYSIDTTTRWRHLLLGLAQWLGQWTYQVSQRQRVRSTLRKCGTGSLLSTRVYSRGFGRRSPAKSVFSAGPAVGEWVYSAAF